MAEFRTEGFRRVAAQLGPAAVGEPVEEEHGLGWGSQSAIVQMTDRGLMWYSPAGNVTLFLAAMGRGGEGERGRDGDETPPLSPPRSGEGQGVGSIPTLEVTDLVGRLPVEPGNRLDLRDVGEISLLVVHWDGSTTPFPDGYDPVELYRREAMGHIAKDWDSEEPGVQGGYGLMYQERISRDGRVWLMRPAEHVVWACRGANRRAYNLAMDAGPGWEVTETQERALVARLELLRRMYRLERGAVVGHGELVADGNATECPGERLLAPVRRYRDGEV